MLLLLLSLMAGLPEAPAVCGTPVFHRLAHDGQPLPTRPSLARAEDDGPRSVTPGPEPGDTVMLWVWNMSIMPPTQFLAPFVCVDKGAHAYVMVHDSALAAGLVDSADAARIIERFERSSPRDSTRGVWQHNIEHIGEPPDEIDNDSLIYLIYYNIGTFGGSRFNGFWMMFDQYYDTTAQRRWGYRSNERECVYLDCWPDNPSGDYRIAIAAHEFAHMIHWNYDPAESLWVQEGICELAMWLFGAPDQISGFPGQPNNDLTLWTGAWADYIKTYLFFLYLYEQYGGRVGTELVHEIVRSTEVSVAGVQAGLDAVGAGADFDAVFADWVLANRINDTAFADGRYGYHGENVPRFNNAAVHMSYPAERTRNLQRWAGEYVLFGGGGGELELEFDGHDAGDFRAFVVGLDSLGNRWFLDTIELDANQRGFASVPGFDTAWHSVWLVPANVHPGGTMSYRYLAAASGIAEGNGPGAPATVAGPTVVRGRLRLTGLGHDPGSENRSGSCPALLLDAAGRRVMDLQPGENDVAQLAPGVYFIRSAPTGASHRLVLAR